MAVTASRSATYADLTAVPEHFVPEVIDGTLETHPRPRPQHALAASDLNAVLGPPFRQGRGGPGGWLSMVEPELHLGPQVVVPNLAGWRHPGIPSKPEAAFIGIPPDWVCQILSPSTMRLDRDPERRIYAEAGIGHLWLLDPGEGFLEGFGFADGRWVVLATIQHGETMALPPFDAVPFPLDDLFPFDDPAAPALPET